MSIISSTKIFHSSRIEFKLFFKQKKFETDYYIIKGVNSIVFDFIGEVEINNFFGKKNYTISSQRFKFSREKVCEIFLLLVLPFLPIYNYCLADQLMIDPIKTFIVMLTHSRAY